MSESENESVVKKIWEAWNRQDIDAYMEYFTDDVTVFWPSGTRGDKESIRRDFKGYIAFSSDRIFRIDRMVSQGNTVWVELTATGTHKGTIFGIPPTNKTWEVPKVIIFELEARKVKQWKIYVNWRRVEQFLRE